MLRKCLAIGLGFFTSASVWALGLGEIQLDSALNENLVAQIPISVTSDLELSGFEARVAQTATFERYGLDRPAFLNDLRFTVVRDRAGNPVLKVSSIRPITEPFVTFLLEANWDRGRLLREYTVLLDPPVFNERAFAPPVEAPQSVTTQNTYNSGQIQPAPTPLPQPEPAPRYVPPAIVGETYGPVQRNENLWNISRSALPSGISMNQMMVAIYRANPEAFMGNINLLKEGSTLRIPNAESVRNLLRSEANQVVVAHNADWRGGRVTSTASTSATQPASTQSSPRLKLVAPDDPVDESGSGVSAADLEEARDLLAQEKVQNVELSNEIDSLRDELEETKRLLNLRNSDLAELQQSLNREPDTVSDTAVDSVETNVNAQDPQLADASASADTVIDEQQGGPDASDSVTSDVEGSETEQAVSLATDPTTDAGTDSATQSVASIDEPVTRQPTPVTTTPSTPEEPSLLAKIGGFFKNMWVIALLGGLGILGTLYVLFKGRNEDDLESWDSAFADNAESDELDLDASLDKVGKETVVAQTSDTSEVEYFEDTGTFKPVDFEAGGEQDGLSGETGAYPFEDTLAGETGVKLDQADALSEADFHMAYGLYDQAAELITKSVENEPERADLRMKLVEIYFMWGNKDEFRKSAETVKNMLGNSSPGEWEKIQIMGSQICPDDPLFESGTTSAPIMSDVVDLQLDATAIAPQALDFDADDFGVGVSDEDDAIDLDLGSELFGNDDAPTAVGEDDNMLDFSFDEPAEDSPTDSLATEEVKEKIEEAVGAAKGSEDTEEMDLDQLGIDLDFGDITSVSDSESFQITEIGAAEPQPAQSELDAVAGAGSDEDFDELFAGLDEGGFEAGSDEETVFTDEETIFSDDSDDKLLDTSELKVEMEQLLASETDTGLIDQDATSRGTEMLDPAELRADDTGSFSAEIRALSDEDSLEIGEELAATSGGVDFGFGGDNDETVLQEALVMPDEQESDDTVMTKTAYAHSDDETVLSAALIGDDVGGDFGDVFAEQADDHRNDQGVDLSDVDTSSMPAISEAEPVSETGTSEAVTFHGVFDADARDAEPDEFSSEVFASTDGRTQEMQAMDLDIGEALEDSSDRTTMRVATSNLALPENADLAINEVGTKLDLARAYLDMGDPDGARGILEEVIEEGNETQQQDARQMLEGLG